VKSYKYLDIVTVAFVAVLLISNLASNKLVVLGPFTFDAGTLLFPLSYIFGDILTEVYGYKRSRRVIWLGFGASALMAVVLWIVTLLPAAPDSGEQTAVFNTAIGSTTYIVLGSLIAFWAGEFSNSIVLAKLKVAMQGRMLWVRTISSTFVGQAVDTFLFLTIAFGIGGALMGQPMDGALFWAILVSNYIFKVGVEVLFTPITYLIVGFLKRAEHEDYYDTNTDFNPFNLSVTSEPQTATR
jgi:uncharacterized integral membrane protein (TIGR00697 family)